MIENRRVWLDRLLSASVEGGFVNDPRDSGGATNLGITAETLGVWRKLGRDASEDEVKGVTRAEAEGIALAMYWNAVRADQLPGGIDIYAADFAFNSGPGTAAEKLQELVATKADGFVGDRTIAAVRARLPRDLLDEYHDSRITYLRSLKSKWPVFGDGWTDRCQQMLKLARSRIDSRPVLAEMLPSQTALGGVGAAAGGLAMAWPQIESLIRGAAEHSQVVASTPGMAGDIGAAAAVIGGLWAAWCRYRDWRTGQR
jgi:lysozyme family protein